ncbi:hypothetical protein [Salinisphaera orenii]|uniref:hypothetical protein n=1 Tax=Salinisphaera orenii TaxID=856731 RepID=UPI003A4C5831
MRFEFVQRDVQRQFGLVQRVLHPATELDVVRLGNAGVDCQVVELTLHAGIGFYRRQRAGIQTSLGAQLCRIAIFRRHAGTGLEIKARPMARDLADLPLIAAQRYILDPCLGDPERLVAGLAVQSDMVDGDGIDLDTKR